MCDGRQRNGHRWAPGGTCLVSATLTEVSRPVHNVAARSAEAVRPGETRREEADEERSREADDVEVDALDALDEARAEALDRVAAGAALPLARGDVDRDVPRRE